MMFLKYFAILMTSFSSGFLSMAVINLIFKEVQGKTMTASTNGSLLFLLSLIFLALLSLIYAMIGNRD